MENLRLFIQESFETTFNMVMPLPPPPLPMCYGSVRFGKPMSQRELTSSFLYNPFCFILRVQWLRLRRIDDMMDSAFIKSSVFNSFILHTLTPLSQLEVNMYSDTRNVTNCRLSTIPKKGGRFALGNKNYKG